MPTFATPEPINVLVALIAGDVRVTASDRTDTVVTVSPSDVTSDADRGLAEATSVEFASGQLVVKTPKSWRHYYSPFSGRASIDVSIELPAGSSIEGSSSTSDFRCDGNLGECRLTTAAGSMQVDTTGPLHLRTTAGRVSVNRVRGAADITATGELRIGVIDMHAVVKNLNGATRIGTVIGDLRCTSSNGDISVDRAMASVVAKTANGSIRVGEVAHNSISLSTAYGDVVVGVADGTAAHLDLKTGFGRVDSDLAPSDGPFTSDKTVEVRARTSYGDIRIHRAGNGDLAAPAEAGLLAVKR